MDMTGSITHSEHRKSRRRNRKKKMARKGSMDDSSKKSYDSQMSELTGDGDSDSLKSDTLESSTRVVKERDNEKSEEKNEEALQSSSVEFEFPLFKKNEGGVSDSSSNKGNKDDSASSSQDVKETSTRNPKAKVWADLVNKCEDAERENKSTPERETEEKEKIAQVIHKIPKNLLSQAFEELVRHSENLKGSPTKDESRSKLKEEQHPEQKSEHELAETSEKEPDPIREDGPKSFWTGRTIALVALVFAIVLGFL